LTAIMTGEPGRRRFIKAIIAAETRLVGAVQGRRLLAG